MNILSIIGLIGVAVLMNFIGNQVHDFIYAQQDNETLFNGLLYLRHIVYGLIFLTGFSFLGYKLMKHSKQEKPQDTKVYRSFLKGEKLCFYFLIASFVHTGFLILFFLIGTDPEVLNTFVNTLMFLYPISIIIILIVYGRDSTYVMDKDR